MLPDEARNLAAQLRDDAVTKETEAATLRTNSAMLTKWAEIMDAAVALNFRAIMPADLITYIDTPPAVPKTSTIPEELQPQVIDEAQP